MGAKYYNRISRSLNVGSGNFPCVCCGPKPGKDRKIYRRRAKRVQRQKDKKLFRNYTNQNPKNHIDLLDAGRN